MSDEAEGRQTMRECRACGALNSVIASVCGLCGASLVGKASGTFEFFEADMLDCIDRLVAITTPDAAEAEMLHKCREYATAFGAWRKRPPSGEDRNRAIREAHALSLRVRDYRRPA